MGRDRIYEDNSERQYEYRRRKKQQREDDIAALLRIVQGELRAGRIDARQADRFRVILGVKPPRGGAPAAG